MATGNGNGRRINKQATSPSGVSDTLASGIVPTKTLPEAPPPFGSSIGIGYDPKLDYNGAIPDLGQYGITGLKQFSGRIYEEFLPQLSGDQALQVYQEMATNSAVVRSALYAIDMLMRQVDWRIDPPPEADNEEQQAAAFVESCLEDMSASWQDTLSEVLSFVVYGWSFHELVYKRRNGQDKQPGLSSKHEDGAIGWRKWPIRAQQARWRWSFSPEGDIQGQWQIPPPDYYPRFIPMEKALLFRTQVFKGNPEGLSVLRGAWVSYYYGKRIKEFEAIGVERNLDGLPVAFVPAEITSPNAPAAQQALFTAIKQIVRNVRRDAQEGLVLPQSYDPDTKMPLFDFKLLSTTGRGRQVNTEEIIQRYNKEIAMTMLADFLFLGQSGVGSFALASTKTALFAQALGAFLDMIAGVVNRHAIPRLLGLNGYALDRIPTLEHGDIDQVDPEVLGKAFQALAAAGFDFSGSPRLARWVLEQFGAPHDLGGEMQEHLEEQQNLKAAEEEARRESSIATMQETASRAKAGELPGDPDQPARGKATASTGGADGDAIKRLEIMTSVAKEMAAMRGDVMTPSEVHYKPQITVNVPEITVPPAQVTVNVPEQAPPNVTVTAPQVTVEAPQVTVPAPVVNVPEAPAPIVHVVQGGKKQTKKTTIIHRVGKPKEGDISHTETVEEEEPEG